MAAYYYASQHHQPAGNPLHPASHTHHAGRSRRAPRLSSQNSHRQFRGVRSTKELAEAPAVSVFRIRFDAGRSFELDDDLEFCPSLLTEDDLHSIHSSSSDRSSLSSGSPSASPLQHQSLPSQHLSPPYPLASTYQSSSSSSSYQPPSQLLQPQQQQQQQQQFHMKIHEPRAVRSRNAIPIVNPSTGMRMASPPLSISPARMQQQSYTRRW